MQTFLLIYSLSPLSSYIKYLISMMWLRNFYLNFLRCFNIFLTTISSNSKKFSIYGLNILVWISTSRKSLLRITPGIVPMCLISMWTPFSAQTILWREGENFLKNILHTNIFIPDQKVNNQKWQLFQDTRKMKIF